MDELHQSLHHTMGLVEGIFDQAKKDIESVL